MNILGRARAMKLVEDGDSSKPKSVQPRNGTREGPNVASKATPAKDIYAIPEDGGPATEAVRGTKKTTSTRTRTYVEDDLDRPIRKPQKRGMKRKSQSPPPGERKRKQAKEQPTQGRREVSPELGEDYNTQVPRDSRTRAKSNGKAKAKASDRQSRMRDKSGKAIAPNATVAHEMNEVAREGSEELSADAQYSSDQDADDGDDDASDASPEEVTAHGQGESDGNSTMTDPDIDMLPPTLSFYNQTACLNKIFQAAIKHKKETYDFDFSQRAQSGHQVKAIHMKRDKIRKHFLDLLTARSTNRIRNVLDDTIDKLNDQIKHLYPQDQADEESKQRMMKEIHIFVVFDLISTLSAALKAYGQAEYHDDDARQWHIDIIVSIMVCITRLYARSLKAPWTIEFKGKKFIRQHMLVPLQSVLNLVQKGIRLENTRLEEDRQRAIDLELTQRQHDDDAANQRLGREYDEKYRRLRYLYTWRRNCASARYPDYARFEMRAKTFEEWKAQRGLWDGASPELDSDGRPIERIAVFRDRPPGKRPPVSSSWHTEAESDWTIREKSALLEGLDDYEGMFQPTNVRGGKF